jgi:bifunctional non-homologous end joining protein LigD
MSLARYEDKRDFTRTPEPSPAPVSRTGPLTFTTQKHSARRLHYDFRLEIDGVLVSWAVPKGPSYNPAERRLAIQTEDHPYDYGTFEGIIPSGEYGAGEVIVWDAGTYTIVEDAELPDFRDRADAERRAREGLEGGHLRLFLNGRKLKGGWSLTRTRGKGTGSQWLFIKRRDSLEDPARDVTLEARSVLSGLRIEDLKAGKPSPPKAHASLRPTAKALAGMRRSPFPEPFEPMLPTLTHTLFQRNDWLYEPKLDGYRVLAFVEDGNVHLRSRGGQEYAEQFPGIVRALAGQPIDAAVFDGELVALGPDGRMSFQRLQNRASNPETSIYYYIFDLLHLDGFGLLSAKLADRKPLLHAVLAPIGGLQKVASFDDGQSLFQAAQANGLEGIVAKKRDSLYEPGRRVRMVEDQDKPVR